MDLNADMKRQEIEAKLIAQALDDEAFRARLIAEPRQAIAEALRIHVRDDVEIEVLQETGEKFYIVLPAPVTELSEAELDAVAGGTAGYQSRRLKNWAVSSA